jgi:hypothetical protein
MKVAEDESVDKRSARMPQDVIETRGSPPC